MSIVTRKGILQAFVLAEGTCNILRNSVISSRQAVCDSIDYSPSLRLVLDKYQWFYDPAWERARALSLQTRAEYLKNKKQ